jgi:hypothetical protein
MSGQTESKTIAQTSLPSEYLVDLINPWVEEVRQTLFYSSSAPFTSAEQANRWFNDAEKTVDKFRKSLDEWEKEKAGAFYEKEASFYAKYPHLNLPDGMAMWVGVLPPEEEFEELRKEGSPECDNVVKTYLNLSAKADEISTASGFSASSLRLYILADIRPTSSTIEWRSSEIVSELPSGISLTNRFVRLNVRGGLSFKELYSTYQRIRRELNTRRKKGFNKKHLELYRMVRRRGYPPSGKGTKAYWSSVQLECNETHKKDRYKTWKGVKITYDRLHKKLNDTLQTKSMNHMIVQ